MFTVIVTEKGGSRQTLKFDEEAISIGRVQGNEIVLPRGNVSKRHAKIEFRNGQFLVSDSGSTNGTYMNGRRVQKRTPITSEDKIYVGDYIVCLEGHEALSPDVVAQEIETVEDDSIEEIDPSPDSSVPVISFLDNPEPTSTKEPDEEPRVSSVKMRQDSGPRRAPSMSLVKDKKVGAPKNKIGKEDATTNQSSEALTKLETFVERIQDRVSREIKRVDKTIVPVKLDPGTAGQVRIIIDDIVSDLVSRGKLPEEVNDDSLRGRAFRSIVDLGPLDAWLDDDEVKMIRIANPTSAFLFKEGKWVEATDNFLSKEDMTIAIRCLGAGLPALDGAVNGISWFRLADGFRVFASTVVGGNLSPSIFVDKTSCPSSARAEAAIPEAVAKVLEKALNSSRRIAVVGGSASARISILESLVDLLPAEDFVVLLEKMSFSPEQSPTRLVLNAQNHGENKKEQDKMAALTAHALALEPDWLVSGGVEVRDVPHILRAAAGRQGVLSELPIGNVESLELELTTAMASAGAPMQVYETAQLMVKAFDFVVTAGRDSNGFATVSGVHEGRISKQGRFEAKKIFGVLSK